MRESRPAIAISQDELAADRDRALALTPVSRETLARLETLAALLLEWQARMNLVAASTLPQLWTRHIADSLQLLGLVDGRIWADLGSGAGFPGLVLACALADTPGASVHLVESTAKKAAFLREVVAATKIPAIVHNQRIEEFAVRGDVRVDIVTARALASLDRLLVLAEPLLKTGAKALFPKGQDVEAELTHASKYWTIQASLLPSKTSPDSRIVLVTGAKRSQKQSSQLSKYS
jgi:16S rRNA (guanine527-N7)-methyltransferase